MFNVNTLIKRDMLEELRRDLNREEIAFLIGPRQSGKTTLMKLIQAELGKAMGTFYSLPVKQKKCSFKIE